MGKTVGWRGVARVCFLIEGGGFIVSLSELKTRLCDDWNWLFSSVERKGSGEKLTFKIS